MKILYLIIFIIGFISCNKNLAEKTETFKVWGNCEKCKKTIESVSLINGVTENNWDAKSKLMTIKFDTTFTNLDAIQQIIAKNGYDNDLYFGDDYAYAKLEECCQYDRKPYELK